MRNHYLVALACVLGAGQAFSEGQVQTSAPSAKEAKAKPSEKKPAARPRVHEPLGEGRISQDVLAISLRRPASIALHNARGQLVFHLDSFRAVEILPLKGLSTGFLYLTLRAGKVEFTQKLVYTGK